MSSESGGLRLRVPREKADQLLTDLAERGTELEGNGRRIEDSGSLDAWLLAFRRWKQFTIEALKATFVGDEAATEFDQAAHVYSWNMADSARRRHDRWMGALADGVNALQSLRERLVFASESDERAGPTRIGARQERLHRSRARRGG